MRVTLKHGIINYNRIFFNVNFNFINFHSNKANSLDGNAWDISAIKHSLSCIIELYPFSQLYPFAMNFVDNRMSMYVYVDCLYVMTLKVVVFK